MVSMKSDRRQRLNILTDVYRLLMDGFELCIVLFDLEVLLNSRTGIITIMIENGLLSVLGDLVVNETDALALVCFLDLHHFYLC